MATTQNTFTGDGSNLGPFSFTFKWLESTDIKVTVAGVLKTAGTHYNLQSLNYSTKTGGQVLFTAGNAPANGAAIVIYRQTDDTDLASTFYSGSAIRAQDLNNNFVQGLYVTQESSNNAAAATAAANAATTTANTALSNSTAAQASAASAISTANSAVSTANSAVSTANSAVSTANSASAAAASAVSTANTANSTASSALSAVSEALAYTTVANVAAIPGSPTNGDSLRITDSTGIESFTPIVGVPVGFVGNSALTVEIYYNGTSSTWVWSRYFPNDPENRYWSGSVIISDTAPLSPTDDSLWYDSIGGRFYIRYNDGNTSQWVDASPQGNRTSTFQAGTAALPGLTPEGDTDTGLYSPGANQLAISTGGSERFRVDSSGRVGIGTTPADRLHVSGGNVLVQTTAGNSCFIDLAANGGASQTASLTIAQESTGVVALFNRANAAMYFATNGTERARIDSSGRLLVGTSSARGYGDGNIPFVQVERATIGGDIANIGVCNNGDNGAGPKFTLAKSRSGSNGGVTVVQNGDSLGSIQWSGADGTDIESVAAQITCNVDGTPGANDMPGRLVFSTCPDGSASPVERLRITSQTPTLIRVVGGNSTDSGSFSFVNNSQAQAWSIATNTTNFYIFDADSSNYALLAQNPTAWTFASDARLKENIEELNYGIETVKELKAKRFNFIGDNTSTIGFIAQELKAIVPEAVSGEEIPYDQNDTPQEKARKSLGVGKETLIPVLVKALQEAIAKIETLEAQNASFEARLTAIEGGTN